ncbi:MAG: HEAT repeat domain-containing protein [Candidatus Aminicenantes bacterium]|nr:HEAT repeat domain-containing protein [Candidatus Aminicenantes bacterium]
MILRSKLLLSLALAGVLAFHFGCQDRNLGILQDSDDDDDKIQAALKLAAKGSKKAVAPLIGVLQDAESAPDLKVAAAFALGEIGDPAAVDPLSETLRSGMSSKVGCEAAKALGRIGDKKAIGVLFEAQANPPYMISPLGLLGELWHERSLVKDLEAEKALFEAYEPSVRERLPSVRWEAARSLAKIIDGNMTGIFEIELKQRQKWEDHLIAVVGGREAFESRPSHLRRMLKSLFCASDLDAKDLEGLENPESIREDYETAWRLRPVFRTYLVLMAIGGTSNKEWILEAFSSPHGLLSIERMALDLYASGHDEFEAAATSWATAHGKRIEYRAQTNIRIGDISTTAPVLLGGAKAPLGQGLPIRWGELRDSR